MSEDSDERDIEPDPKRRVEHVSDYIFHYLLYAFKKRETVTNLSYETKGLPELPFYSKSIHSIVGHFHKAFKDLLQAGFDLHLHRPIENEFDYASYGISTCKRFIDNDFSFLLEEFEDIKLPYFLFLMSAVFLFELENISSDQDHLTYFACEPKCLVIVYDRYLKKEFRNAGGFRGFMDYCDSVWDIFECLPNVLAFRVMGKPGYGGTLSKLRSLVLSSIVAYTDTNDLSESERRYFGDDLDY